MKRYYSLLVLLIMISTIIVVVLASKSIETDHYFDNENIVIEALNDIQ